MRHITHQNSWPSLSLSLISPQIRQISPFGVLFKTIPWNGVVLKVFSAWDSFGRKMHVGIKQTASGTSEFAVPWRNRHWKWRFGHTLGTVSQTGEFQQLALGCRDATKQARFLHMCALCRIFILQLFWVMN